MSSIISWIADLINSLVGVLTDIFGFVKSTVMGLFSFVADLPRYISYLTSVLGYLPSWVAMFAFMTITIAVIYVILGRSANE